MGVRRVVAFGLTAVPAVVSAVLLLTVRDVPDPLPTHWDLHGDVDGTMSRTAFTVMTLAVTIAAAAVAVAFTRAHEDDRVRRYALTACAFAAYLVGGLSVLTLLLARGADSAGSVGMSWFGLAAVLAVAVLVPAVVRVSWPVVYVDDAPPAADLPRIDLAPRERAAYVTTVRSRGFVALGIGCAVLGVLLLIVSDLVIGATVLAVTVAVLSLSRVTLRVDQAGLQLGFGPGVRIRVALDDIRQASVEDIRPLEWGGWGYRIRPGRRGLILRAGPGLVLELRNGSRFGVTVDAPERPVALLNGLLERRTHPS